MTTLVVGASGATGRLLVEQLLNNGECVKIIVRSKSNLPQAIGYYRNLSIIYDHLTEFTEAELLEHTKGCHAVISCLGHNLSFKGIYGKPRFLVTDVVRNLCRAIKANQPQEPVKFVLMNTAGNRNRDLSEPISFAQRCVMAAIRLLVPPHLDNEHAAEYFRTEIGQNDPDIEWVIVRPDSLSDEIIVTEYEVFPSPTRSAIFNAGTTSRMNVGHFMMDLVLDRDVWQLWKGKMPVIYNKSYNT
jgi:NAD(P)-dependent dehydrogenase (short-subunit alcohol dehydrogenase family)